MKPINPSIFLAVTLASFFSLPCQAAEKEVKEISSIIKESTDKINKLDVIGNGASP